MRTFPFVTKHYSVRTLPHRSARPLTIGALLLALSGCAWFGEDSRRAQMMAMPEFGNTLASARAELATSERWPEQDWWTVFADPVLNRLISDAVTDNPDLKVVAAKLRQSQALVDMQGAELYPTVDANISFSAQRFSANSVQAKLAGEHFRQLLINPLVLRYHLDFWGRDKAALQAAVGRSLAVTAELADARLLMSVAVAGAYFDLQAALEKQALAERIVADREKLAKLQRIRLDTGLSGEPPLLQAQMTLNGAKQIQASLFAEVKLHQHRLSALLGQGADWGQNITVQSGKRHTPILPLPKDLPLRLLSRRPDLTAARLQAEAAAEEIKVAETAFYPDVNLFAFTGLHSVSLTDIALQGSSLAYAVGPAVEFPIFEGGRLRANLNYRQSAYDAAIERYNAGLVHAVQEVADALSRSRELDIRLAEQRQSLRAAAAKHRLADTLVSTGLADHAKRLQVRIDENRERLSLAALEAQQRKASVNLIKALGGGYNDTVINTPTH